MVDRLMTCSQTHLVSVIAGRHTGRMVSLGVTAVSNTARILECYKRSRYGALPSHIIQCSAMCHHRVIIDQRY